MNNLLSIWWGGGGGGRGVHLLRILVSIAMPFLFKSFMNYHYEKHQAYCQLIKKY